MRLSGRAPRRAPGRLSGPMPGRAAAFALWLARRFAVRSLVPAARPKPALAALGISVAALITTALLGPSAAVEPLPGPPPFGWRAHPSPTLVTALLVVTVVAGAYGVAGCLAALRRGWVLDTRKLMLGAILVTALLGLLAPVGSSDPGSYASYGRLAATGHDPYATPPSTLTGPYRGIAEPPWQGATSVYGPVATGEQWVAAKLAGDGPHAPAHAVFILGVVNALAFIAAGLLLQRLASGQAGRRRAAVLFSANPLLLFEGVAGAHVDVLLTFFMAAALLVFRRSGLLATFAAGALGGAAAGVKAIAGLAGIGLAWAVTTTRKTVPGLVALALGAAAVLVPGYLIAGPHAFDQLRHASNFVSFADPWRIVTHPLEAVFGHDRARDVIRALAWLFFVLFALLLDRGLPGRRRATGQVGDPAVAGARAALVLVLAWLLTAPYVLPWYAVLAFALLALLPASGFDRLLLFWISVLAVAYLPGRQVPLPGALRGALDVWKSGFSPALLLVTALVALVLCIRLRA